jgi:hypothetical protein
MSYLPYLLKNHALPAALLLPVLQPVALAVAGAGSPEGPLAHGLGSTRMYSSSEKPSKNGEKSSLTPGC